MFWCMFEQSGTFKNQLKKLGQDALDIDILDDFGETDLKLDIFGALYSWENASNSFLDAIKPEDTIIAFFPCVRFEAQILLRFTGNAYGMDKRSQLDNLEENQILQSELHHFITNLNKLVRFALYRGCRLIIENPWGSYSYLRERWCFKPSVVISNRRRYGDYFVKPTAFWFFNGDAYDNVYFEPVELPPAKKVESCSTVERSMISPQFARYFLRTFVLPPE